MTQLRKTGALCTSAASGLLAAVILTACSSSGLGDLVTGPSDPVVSDPAEIELTAANRTISVEGGALTIDVANSGGRQLRWSASSDQGFARITSGSSGTNTGAITATFDENPTDEQRQATITVRSADADNSPQTVQLTQEAGEPEPEPTLEASSSDYSLSGDGQTVTVTVTVTPDDAQWDMQSLNARWIRVLGTSSGTGSGKLTLEVDANDTEAARSVVVEVQLSERPGIAVELNFSQAALPPVELTINTDKTTLPAEGGDAVMTISLNSDTAIWTAAVEGSPAPAWVQLRRSGDSLTVQVQANPQEDNRTFAVRVTSTDAENSPQSVQFTQEGAELPELAIQANDYLASSEGQTIEITISLTGNESSSTEWRAEVSSGSGVARIVGSASGTGDGSVSVEVDANNGDEQRGFTVTVFAPGTAGLPKELSFVQEAQSRPTYTVTADDYTATASGQQIEIRIVFAGGALIEWTASITNGADVARIIGSSSGSGDAGLVVEVDANPDAEQRGFELTVTAEQAMGSPKTLNFVQSAATLPRIQLSGSPSTLTVPHSGGTVRVSIENSGGGQIEWVATTEASFLEASGSSVGTGSGSVVYVAEENEGEARSFAIVVQDPGAENSPQRIAFTQEAAPGEGVRSAKISANKYTVASVGETVTITVDMTGNESLAWSAELGGEDATCTIRTLQTDEDGMVIPGEYVSEDRSRGDWVRFLGPSNQTGDGDIEIQVDSQDDDVCPTLRWAFHVAISFADAEELSQTLHFSQEGTAGATLSLWAATLQVGAGGETVEMSLTTPGSDEVYWTAVLSEDWARFVEGGVSIENTIDGTGPRELRIETDPNTATASRTVMVTVQSTDATNSPQSLTFRQAGAAPRDDAPQPPAVPGGYSSPCQRGTVGFENFGGWLYSNGRYDTTTEGRVWRYTDSGASHNAGVKLALTDCTDDKRTFTREISHRETPLIPEAFSDLPADTDKRVVLLDLRIPSVGEHLNGARPDEDTSDWTDYSGGWFRDGYTDDSDTDTTKFLLVQPLGDWGYGSKEGWKAQVEAWKEDDMDAETLETEMGGWTTTADNNGWRLPSIQEGTAQGSAAIADHENALWIVVGGYSGTGATRQPHENSAVCGEMGELCLFAPWSYSGNSESGTAVAAAQTAALLDSFLLLWPDYDLLELRNFVFECAEDMGIPGVDSRWGHGILNASCLFSPQGDLIDPRTGAAITGGIYGPVGNIFGDAITGFDRTGRDFAYPVTRWRWRDNEALLALSGAESASEPFSGQGIRMYAPGVSRATLLDSGPFQAQIAAAGDAVAAISQWRAGGLWKLPGFFTFRGGFAMQPEGAGSLTGERAFRAPATFSSAISFAWQHSFSQNLTLHAQGQYWMTLAAEPRSLWTGMQLSEARASASLVYRHRKATFTLQGQYFGGLGGRLDVAEQKIRLTPQTTQQFTLRVRAPFNW